MERDEHPFTSIHVPSGLNRLRPEELALSAASKAGGAGVRLEPIEVEGVETLLVAAPRRLRVRVNGLPAPAIALLRVGDQLRIGTWPVLHVSAYRRARIEPASGELLGRNCGLCRTALTEGTTVVVHECGVSFHLDAPTGGGGEPLSCATIAGDCPSCGKPVRTEDGWAWHPEERP